MLAALFINEASQESGASSGEGGGGSVDDGIHPDEFTVHYITLDQVIRVVSKLGVEAAYRNVPVHPSHPVLLGMK